MTRRPMLLSSLLAVTCAGCIAAPLRSTLSRPPTPVEAAELWEEPRDLAARNLFDGPWKADLAPNPAAAFTFVNKKAILNESDLKNSNNSLYAVKGHHDGADEPEHWYVVRDIGTALGETGRLNPQRNDPGLFERTRFITGVKNGVVQFNYHGRHQELAGHISPEDVRWMCDLLAQLSLEQWQDAFRAGGYDEATAARFIARIRGKVAEGQAVAQGSTVPKPVAGIHELRDKYVWSTLGFEGALHATVTSSLEQWRKTPPEWRSDANGYTKRWVSDYAESAIGGTAKYAVARLFRQDPSFTRCECSGFARRLLHAADSPFMARRTDGTRVPSVASLAGFLTGHVVSAATWYPAPLGSRDGLRHGGLSLLTKVGLNVFHEFADRSR